MVVTTIRSPRCRASTPSASWCVIAMASLRQQDDRGLIACLGLLIGRRQIAGSVRALEDLIAQPPGLHDRLGVDRTGVARGFLLMAVVAAHAYHEEKRQLQIVDEVAQRVPGLE